MSARETVATETPLRFASSRMVAMGGNVSGTYNVMVSRVKVPRRNAE